MTGLETVLDRRIRIYKFDRVAEIKNFIYSTKERRQITALLPSWSFISPLHKTPVPYALLSDGSIKKESSFHVPDHFSPDKYGRELVAAHYVYDSTTALVKNKLHVFGGCYNANLVNQKLKAGVKCFLKIARLDGCKFAELPESAWLENDFSHWHLALTIEAGSKGQIV